MPKLNVILDTSPLRTGSQIRGIGAYTRLLKQALEQRDDVSVIPVQSREDLKNVKRNFPQLDKKSTIIHYPFFDLFFATLPLFRSFKTVVTVHDVIPLKFPQHYKPGKKGQLRYLRQSYGLQHVDGVITDSQASARDVHQYLKVRQDRLHVVYLAASPEIKAQSELKVEAVKDELKLPPDYVLYVGDINYNKNIPQLIKMTKFLPDNIHLVCVGKNFYPHDIPEWQWIEVQLALSDVGHKVHFINTLDVDATSTLSAIYSGAIAYIQPSLYEGFGLPVLEAMQAKCPVIATSNSSLVEVTGNQALLVQPEAEQFAAAVKEIADWTKTHRQEVIKSAFEWSQTFSWDRVAQETIQVYKQVLGL
jgi:glycosyltransferase involved in cell wall biosynthesis